MTDKPKVVSTVSTQVPTVKEGKEVKLVGKLLDTGQISVSFAGYLRPVEISELRAGLGRIAHMLEPSNR